MFSLINILNCLPHLIFVPKHICTRLTILTSSKNNHKIKVAETLQWPVGSQPAPLGLNLYYFIISENADCIDYLYGEGGRGGSAVKEVARVKWAIIIISHYCLYIYNLFRVSLFHSDETFPVYACTRSVFIFK